MKAKSIVAFVGLVLVMTMACSEHTIEPVTEYANGRVVGTIHGVVMDYQNDVRFDTTEVQVSWVSGGEVHTKNLDTLGYYIITDLVPGYYDLTFHGAEDYTVTKVDSVYVPTLEEVNDGSYATDQDYEHIVARNVWLYKKNSAIKGTVFAKQNDQTSVPAAGAVIVADYSLVPLFSQMLSASVAQTYHISPDRFRATVDASGNFKLSGLPSADAVAVYVEEYAEGSNEYEMENILVGLSEDDTVTVDNIVLEIAGDAPVLLSNNFANETSFSINSNLTMTFNKTMDATTFQVVLQDGNGNDVDVDVSWLNGVTLTVNPVEALDYGTNYTLKLKGWATTDNTAFKDEDNVDDFVEIGFKTVTKYAPVVLSTNFYDMENMTFGVNMAVDVTLTATFSKAMNTTDFRATLYMDSNGNADYDEGIDEAIESAVSWNTTALTVTIDPIVNLATDNSYYVEFIGWSTDSMALAIPDLDNNSGNGIQNDPFFFTVAGIKFVSTTLENAQGEYEDVPVSDATTGLGPNIQVKFSRAIDLTNSKTEVYLEDYDDVDGTYHTVRATVQATSDGLGFIITPEYALESNEDYYLVYDVYSAIPGDHASVSDHPDAQNYGGTDKLKFTTVISESKPAAPAFVLQTATTAIDWNTVSMTFRIRTVSNADEYIIYAKGTTKNSDLVEVGTVLAQPQQVYVYAAVTLPQQFDYYPNDAYGITPFVDGETVSFFATAVNEAGESAKSSAVVVGDGAGPNNQVVTQTGSTDNSANTNVRTITITISAANGEYLHTDAPTWQFLDANNDAAILATTAVQTSTLNNDRTRWTVTIAIPASSTYVGDTARITVKDSNGQSGVYDYTLDSNIP